MHKTDGQKLSPKQLKTILGGPDNSGGNGDYGGGDTGGGSGGSGGG